jgi:carbon monoxide dehydrogenase subunit G
MAHRIGTTATVEVAVPFDRVWEVVSDLHRYAEWVEGTIEVLEADPVAEVGAGYTERNRVVGPLTARSRWTVVDIDRARGVQRHETTGMPGIPSFAVVLSLAPTPAGTRAALGLEGTVDAGPLSRPLGRLLERSLRTSNARTVAALATLLAAEQTAATA